MVCALFEQARQAAKRWVTQLERNTLTRTATVSRDTKETQIEATITLDGTGAFDIATGIGFLDHMLEQLSRHSLIDLRFSPHKMRQRFLIQGHLQERSADRCTPE